MNILIVHTCLEIMTEAIYLFFCGLSLFVWVVGGKLSPVRLVIPLSAVCLQPVKYKQPLTGPFPQIMYFPLPPLFGSEIHLRHSYFLFKTTVKLTLTVLQVEGDPEVTITTLWSDQSLCISTCEGTTWWFYN